MIVGAVSSLFEPQISSTVLSRGGNPIAIDATIDTGSNGYLSLNRSLISSLEIPFLARRQDTQQKLNGPVRDLGSRSTVLMAAPWSARSCYADIASGSTSFPAGRSKSNGWPDLLPNSFPKFG